MWMHRNLGVLGMALGAQLIASSAHAQAGATAIATSVDEVIVTAMKRGENVQSVPASVTALSGADLANRGVSNIEQLSMAVPNLNFGVHDGATFITIRGVGSTINSGVTEPTVAAYVDGVFLPRATMGSLQQVDLERVEVLRGPQGTLYGRNATGGAVNFISRAPTRDFEGEATLGGGSRSAFGASGFVSGPLSSDVDFRLSGGHDEHQSYLRVVPSGRTDEVQSDYVRAALSIRPTSDLTVDLAVKYEHDKGSDTYQQLLTSSSSPLLPPLTLQTTAPNRTAADAPFRLSIDTLISSATINWQVSDAVALRSITGYINHHARTDFDADATSYPFFTADGFVRPSNSVSQEFDAFGETGQLKWLVGAYYFNEHFLISLPVAFPSGLPGALPPNARAEQSSAERTRSYAVFTDLTWSLTDRLRLNGGLRYNSEVKRFLFTGGAFIPGAGFFGVVDQRSRLSSHKVLPKIGIQYDLSDDANVYAQFQKGFKSGGHNLSLDTLYGSEDIGAYEVGLKSQWLDRRLTANFAGFYYDYKGLQITNNVGPTTTAVENADAHIYGLEAEGRFALTPDITLNAAATWLHARYTDFVSFDSARPGLGFFNLKGETVVRSPDYTLNLGAEWRVPIESRLVSGLTLRADLFHSDDIVLRYFAQPNDIQSSYTIANLSAAFKSADGKTSLRVFVNNVGNKLYLRQVDYLAAIGVFDGNYSEPRTWGARLTRRF
jgi:iron complex outermembrane recepter protein